MMSSQSIRRQPCRPPSPQLGFTLVEVLVALVVLGVGLLGVAKMVLSAVKADDSAYMRSQATQFAYGVLDLMRANQTAAIAGSYSYPDTRAVASPGVTCTSASCSTATLAQWDVYDWQNRLAAVVPAGYGAITVTQNAPAAGSTLVTVTVFWNDSRAQWAFGTASTTTPGATGLTMISQL